MNDTTNEIQTLINTLLDNPIALISCLMLAIGIILTFLSKQFILVRLLLGDVSFIKQRLIGILLGIVGALLLYWSTGNL
ncbi:hypothetical protein LALA110947_04255 [Lactococcus laudensis]|nr:hypothetical protein [Lactococcus laudensis]